MIIWGTRGLTSTRQRGIFHCPRCGPQRGYEHKVVTRYFTLYFIPVIPMGKAGEYIECQQCSGTFGPEAVTYDPEAARQETIDHVKRLLYAVVTNAGPLTDARLTRLQDTLEHAAGVHGEIDDLRQALEDFASARTPLATLLRGAAAPLSEEGKTMVFASAFRVLADEGRLTPSANTCLRELGTALGMKGAILDQSIAALAAQARS